MCYSELLNEYISLCDFTNEYFQKDFKGNVRFVKSVVKKMLSNKQELELCEFLKTLILVHKSNFMSNIPLSNSWGVYK